MKQVLESFQSSVFGDEASYTYVPDFSDLSEKADSDDLAKLDKKLSKKIKELENAEKKCREALSGLKKEKADASDIAQRIDNLYRDLRQEKSILNAHAITLSSNLSEQATTASAQLQELISTFCQTEWEKVLAPSLTSVKEHLQPLETALRSIGSVQQTLHNLEDQLQQKTAIIHKLEQDIKLLSETITEKGIDTYVELLKECQQTLSEARYIAHNVREDQEAFLRLLQQTQEQQKDFKEKLKQEIIEELSARRSIFSIFGL